MSFTRPASPVIIDPASPYSSGATVYQLSTGHLTSIGENAFPATMLGTNAPLVDSDGASKFAGLGSASRVDLGFHAQLHSQTFTRVIVFDLPANRADWVHLIQTGYLNSTASGGFSTGGMVLQIGVDGLVGLTKNNAASVITAPAGTISGGRNCLAISRNQTSGTTIMALNGVIIGTANFTTDFIMETEVLGALDTQNNSDAVKLVFYTILNGTALNNAGMISITNNPGQVVKTSAAATAPDAPSGVSAVAGNGKVSVYFTVGNNNGAPITDNIATLSNGQTNHGTSSPIVVPTPNGTAVTATVVSQNNIGNSNPSSASNQVTPSASASTAPFIWQFLGNEGDTVTVPANTQVRYGAGSTFITKTLSGTFTINNSTFTDPLPGTVKHADSYIQQATATSVVVTMPSVYIPVAINAGAIQVSLNGFLETDVPVSISAPGVTFTPATFTLNAANPVQSVIPFAQSEVDSVVHVTNTGGMLNPADTPIHAIKQVTLLVTNATDATAAAQKLAAFDCVAAQQSIYVVVDNNMTFTGQTFSVKNSNEDYHAVITPNTGKGHQDLDKTGPLNYGTLGVELTLNTGNAITLEPGVRLRGFRINITAQGALHAWTGNPALPGIVPRVEGCKIMANAFGAISNTAYNTLQVYDNLILRNAPVGGLLADGAWSLDCRRNTWVLQSGGTADGAHSGGWGATYDPQGSYIYDNVYWNFTNGTALGTFFGANNYTNVGSEVSNGNSGGVMVHLVTGQPFFVDANADYRPSTALLGKGSTGMISTNDVRGNNRGLAPDMGAAQATPALPLVVPVITSQSFSNGTLLLNGTYTGTAASGTAWMDPVRWTNGVPRQSSANFTINSGNNTWTASITGIPREDYRRPEVRMSNSGGIGPRAEGGANLNTWLPIPATPEPLPTLLQPVYWQADFPYTTDNLTKRVDHHRIVNGVDTVVATYTELGDLFAVDGRAGAPTVPLQDGDTVLVYPGLYKKQVFMGAYGADSPVANITVRGVTVNGKRPALYWDGTPGGYGYGDNMMFGGNGILYVHRLTGDNNVWENIDVISAGGYMARALVYVQDNQAGGTLTLRNMRMMGSITQGRNGMMSSVDNRLSLLLENCESGFHGGGGAPPPVINENLQHGFYFNRITPSVGNLNPKITIRGCFFHNTWYGHILKCRHNDLTVEGCYFMGSTSGAFQDTAQRSIYFVSAANAAGWGEVSELDMPNGGKLVFRNNILTKSYTGDDMGLFFINWGAESNLFDLGDAANVAGSVDIYNNTFVGYSNVVRWEHNSGATPPPIAFGFVNGQDVPDSDTWPRDRSPVSIRNNVYAGLIANGQFFEEHNQFLTMAEINLPGIDGGVPFVPKVSKGSIGESGAGHPMYVHRATFGTRTDHNMGGVGTLAANVTPTGFATLPLMAAQSNMTAGLVGHGNGIQYPLQYEWVNNNTLTTVNSGTTGTPITPVTPPPTSRDVLKQPFASASIWNTAIGSAATYVDAALSNNPSPGTTVSWPDVDAEHIILKPTAPATPVRHSDAAFTGTDRTVSTGTVVDTVPIPANYAVNTTTDLSTAAVLRTDGRTVAQFEPFARGAGLGYATTFRVAADVDLYGDGIAGTHFDSGLSALGGSLRIGELRPGGQGARHALKVQLYPQTDLFKATVATDAYRWPASKAAANAVGVYGSTSNNTNQAMKMGALLAIPANVNLTTLGLTTEPAKQLAWTLQNYGAYVVDGRTAPGITFSTEEGPDGSFSQQFSNDYGFALSQTLNSGTPSNGFAADLKILVDNLFVVDNNSPSSIGGGGTPLQPAAPAVTAPTTPPVINPPPPAPAAGPTVTITTLDNAILRGNIATLTGTYNFQGDAAGKLAMFMDPQPSGTPQPMPTVSINGGVWTCSGPVPIGSYEFRIVATANSQSATAISGTREVLSLTNNVYLPV